MKNTVFLTFEQVIVVHDDQIQRYNGSHGIHDLSLLESAVMRPQASFGGRYLYPTLFEKTAAMIHSLVMNHAFVDGNKRTAMVSGIIMLDLNDYKLTVSQEELIKTALDVRHGRLDVKSLSQWLKKNCKKIK